MQTKLFDSDIIDSSDFNESTNGDKNGSKQQDTHLHENTDSIPADEGLSEDKNNTPSSKSKRIKTAVESISSSPSGSCTNIHKLSVNLKSMASMSPEAACYKKILKLAEKQQQNGRNIKTDVDIVSEIKKEVLTVKSQRSMSSCSEDSSIKYCLNQDNVKPENIMQETAVQAQQIAEKEESVVPEKKSLRIKARRNSEQKDKAQYKPRAVTRQSPPVTRKKRERAKTTIDLTQDTANIKKEIIDSNKNTSAVAVSPVKLKPERRSKNKIETLSTVPGTITGPATVAPQPVKVPVKRERKSKLTQSTLSFQAVPKNTASQGCNNSGTGQQTSLNTFACLRNLGSTCYINCIIQVMRYTPGFVASIHRLNKQIDHLESLSIEIENEVTSNNNAKFVKNLHQLLVEMTEKEKLDRRPIYSPVKFVKTVWTLLSFWSNGSQQDAHEFLQYTIHFINECDLFIRKLQQQHQIKPNQNFMDDLVSPNKTSPTTQQRKKLLAQQEPTKSPTPPTPRRTKNSLKTATLIETILPKTDPPKSPRKNSQSTSMPDTAVKEEGANKIEGNLSAHVKTETTTSNTGDDLLPKNVINQQLSARLLKSIPQFPKTTVLKTTSSPNMNTNGTDNNNFLRTPTKGGASAYNTTNNASSAKANKMTESLVASPSTLPITISSKSPIKSGVNKPSEPKDTYSFDLDDSDNFNVFKTAGKLALVQSPKDMYDFELNESMETSMGENTKSKLSDSVSNVLAEKCLVSKRIKETILKSENKLTTKNKSRRSMPASNFEYQQNNIKKMKHENGIRTSESLNDSLNSIIMIDSENDEDCNLVSSNPTNRPTLTLTQLLEPPTTHTKPSEESLNTIVESSATTSMLESKVSAVIAREEVKVMVEKLDINKITSEYEGLIIADSVFEILSGKKVLNGKEEQPLKSKMVPPASVPLAPTRSNSTSNDTTTAQNNNVKKLRSKSKTLPLPVPVTSNIAKTHAPTNKYTGSLVNGSIVDLNAISVVNPVSKPINVMNNNGVLSTNPITDFRSKLRSTASSSSQRTDAAPSLSICSVLPPSPAELLRKYSTSSGYTCEMDKLFKGSSVTVTQCLGCENLRKCPEAFYDRSIPIDTNDDGTDDDQADSEVNWISKCLSNESYLNENSKYMCDKCQSKQEAKIHTQYTQMPNILILHLLSYGITSSVDGNLNAQKLSNRSRLVNYFDYTSIKEPLAQSMPRSIGKMDWMNSPIAAKIKLNQILANRHHFTLFAVVMHSGTTLNSGHYTAFVNYKIISQSISETYSNELSTQVFSKLSDQQNLTTDSNYKSCCCFLDTNKNLNNNNNNTNINNLNDTNSNSSSSFISTNSNNTTNNNALSIIPNTSAVEPLTSLNSIKSEKPLLSIPSSESDSQLQWLHFDDTKVKSLTNLEFQRKIVDSSFDSPYILFYVKN